jgi:GNAT superfamily N-acetyltransferase
MSAPPRTDLSIRPFRQSDEANVLALLRTALGEGPAGRRSAEFFRWKHLQNPFGRSFLLVGEVDGRIVGLRAFLRWQLRLDDSIVAAVRAVDTATHPEHQGRGVFSQLTYRAIEELREQVDLVFNTPNEKSLPGYLKMGWRPVGSIRVSVRVRRPGAVARGFAGRHESGGPPRIDVAAAGATLEDLHAVERLLGAAEEPGRRLATARTAEYLRWRYADVPLLDYRAIALSSAGELQGLVVFRVRNRRGLWEATIAELIVAEGDLDRSRRLIREVVRSCPVDVLTARFPSRSTAARALRGGGFLPVPKGFRLVVRPFRPIGVDPERLGSWALALGDVEVF